MQQQKQFFFYRYAGVIESPEVEANHLARKLPVRLLVLKRHQEAPVPRGEAPRKASEVRIDLGQVQHLKDRRDSALKVKEASKDTNDFTFGKGCTKCTK